MNTATQPQRTAREKILMEISTMLVAIGDGASSGEVYSRHCNEMTLSEYQGTLGLMKASDLVIEASHWLTLTAKGKNLLADVVNITLGRAIA